MGKPLFFFLALVLPAIGASAGELPPFALILAPESLIKEAAELQRWHADSLHLKSEVVSVEGLRKSVGKAPLADLPFEGGADEKKVYFKRPYTGELSAQLIRYVRERAADKRERLNAVILFGGPEDIPPSHYLYFKSRRRWLPTDACYGGELKCEPGKIAVGRLPFGKKAEWDRYLAKLKVWETRLAARDAGFISLAGTAFAGPVFVGESAALAVTESVARAGVEVKKLHRSRGNYDVREAELALSGQLKKPYLMHLDHGDGNEIRFDGQGLGAAQIAEWKANAGSPPVAFSIACANAALDYEAVNEKLLKRPDDGHGTIAGALLKSVAGPIAYVGSWRRAMGEPLITVSKTGGVSVPSSTYGVKLLSQFAERLVAWPARSLGEVFVKSVLDYYSVKGAEEEDRRLWTVFNFSLLGDPLLPLPALTTPVVSSWQAGSQTKLERTGDNLPLDLLVTDRSQAEALRFYKVGEEARTEKLGERRLDKGANAWTVSLKEANAGDHVMVRVENREAPFEERQFWLGPLKE